MAANAKDDSFAEYAKLSRSGRLNSLFNMPQGSAAMSRSIYNNNAIALHTILPGNNPISNALKRNKNLLGKHMFAVGYHNTTYNGYRMVTKDDWINPKIQAAIVMAHQRDRGWPLLEKPLVCKGPLFVAEGYAKIDGATIIEVGHNYDSASPQKLNGMYSAVNNNSKKKWTEKPPMNNNSRKKLIEKTPEKNREQPAMGPFNMEPPPWGWTVFETTAVRGNYPCLYVINDTAGGGKKTHRRKKSKRSKKVRTRKH